MIITKEQQEVLVEKYIKKGNDYDKCVAFIDGMDAIIDFIKSKNTQ